MFAVLSASVSSISSMSIAITSCESSDGLKLTSLLSLFFVFSLVSSLISESWLLQDLNEYADLNLVDIVDDVELEIFQKLS